MVACGLFGVDCVFGVGGVMFVDLCLVWGCYLVVWWLWVFGVGFLAFGWVDLLISG